LGRHTDSALFVAVTINPNKRNANAIHPALWVAGHRVALLPTALLPSDQSLPLSINSAVQLNFPSQHSILASMFISVDLEEDDPREDHYAQTIAERESWLRSFGMMPYTTPDEFMSKMNVENIESRKLHGMLPLSDQLQGSIADGVDS
jgi:hypothetical protein